jgi:hypothetical protein
MVKIDIGNQTFFINVNIPTTTTTYITPPKREFGAGILATIDPSNIVPCSGTPVDDCSTQNPSVCGDFYVITPAAAVGVKCNNCLGDPYHCSNTGDLCAIGTGQSSWLWGLLFPGGFWNSINTWVQDTGCTVTTTPDGINHYDNCNILAKIASLFLDMLNFIASVIDSVLGLLALVKDGFLYLFEVILPNLDIILVLGECLIIAYILSKNYSMGGMIMEFISMNWMMFMLVISLIFFVFRSIAWVVSRIYPSGSSE